MINTALLMEMGTDQGSVRPANTDRGATGGISFSQSFDERVGSAVEIFGDSPASKIGTGLETLKDEPPVKITNEVSAVLPELNGKTVATDKGPEYGEVRGTISRKIVLPQKPVVLGSQAKTMLRDSEMTDVISPANVESATEDSSVIPQDAKGLSFKNDAFLPQVKAEDQLLAPGSEEMVVQKGTTRAGMALEIVPAQKNEKSRAGKTAPTVLQKIMTVAHPVAIAAGSVSATQGADPKTGHTIEIVRTPALITSAAPKANLNSTSDRDLDDGVSVTETIVTKDTLDGIDGKPVGVDVETALPVAGDQEGSAKSGAGVEKLFSAATPASGDSDVRIATTSGLVITVAHAMVVSAVDVSAILAHANSPNDPNVMKLTTGETGGRATGLPVELREQDISGGVGGSIDRPETLTATPTALEVGVQSGTHGWLKVRAEMAETGVINASVSASSTTGQEMLHRELPALTAYLQSEKVAVNEVTVHAATAESRGVSAGMDGGNAGQTLQGGNEGGGRRHGAAERALNDAGNAVSYESLNAIDDNGALPLTTYVGGGNWLSIRA
jgi:hypothetical protein